MQLSCVVKFRYSYEVLLSSCFFLGDTYHCYNYQDPEKKTIPDLSFFTSPLTSTLPMAIYLYAYTDILLNRVFSNFIVSTKQMFVYFKFCIYFYIKYFCNKCNVNGNI